jgi:hypothetical protein
MILSAFDKIAGEYLLFLAFHIAFVLPGILVWTFRIIALVGMI